MARTKTTSRGSTGGDKSKRDIHPIHHLNMKIGLCIAGINVLKKKKADLKEQIRKEGKKLKEVRLLKYQ